MITIIIIVINMIIFPYTSLHQTRLLDLTNNDNHCKIVITIIIIVINMIIIVSSFYVISVSPAM